ncbi:MAG: NTP transferase domain-containing protein [Candidatus Eisenbacteria sp.]|nr:NTP transferase domain-containing protein [Candidatus Eisenbacteria bacterium]
MKAVIPVAGVGTRLRPHTHTVPKALLQVAGKPILGHIIDTVASLQVDEIILVVGYMREKIEDYVSRNYSLPIRAVVQEEPKGLGHAVYVTRESVADGEPLLVILGDTIFDLDFSPIVKGGGNLIGVREIEDPRRFGVVKSQGTRIEGFVEKPERPPSNLAIVGLYYFTDGGPLFSALDEVVRRNIRTRGEYQLTDALQLMLERGHEMTCLHIEGWFDCGNRETLLETNRYLLDRVGKPADLETAIVVPPVSIDPAATVENSIVGPYASVAAGAVIRNSIVRNSIVGERATVESTSLEGSLIGDNAVVRDVCRRLNVGDSSEVA